MTISGVSFIWIYINSYCHLFQPFIFYDPPLTDSLSSSIFQAKRIQSNELAAIKVIKLEQGDDIQIIQQEIIMMRDCRHPNIIAYYGSYLRRDKLWICMEYCGGGSLQDIYQVSGPLTERQIAYMCRETLKGLEYLHSMGKMHRDIKGANILLTENGDVKLADFGVSAQITATINKRRSFIGEYPKWKDYSLLYLVWGKWYSAEVGRCKDSQNRQSFLNAAKYAP